MGLGTSDEARRGTDCASPVPGVSQDISGLPWSTPSVSEWGALAPQIAAMPGPGAASHPRVRGMGLAVGAIP